MVAQCGGGASCPRHAAGLPTTTAHGAPSRCGLLSRSDLTALAGAAAEVLRRRGPTGPSAERTVLVLVDQLDRHIAAAQRLDRAYEDAATTPGAVLGVIEALRGGT